MKKKFRLAVLPVVFILAMTSVVGSWADGSGVLIGDIDGDGYAATPLDAMILARHLAGWSGYENIDKAAADIDEDNNVTPRDLLIMNRYIADWPEYKKIFETKPEAAEKEEEPETQPETQTMTVESFRSAVSGASAVTLMSGWMGGGKFEISEKQYNALSYYRPAYNDSANTAYAGLNTTMRLYTIDEATDTVTIGTILYFRTWLEQGIDVRYYLDLGPTVLHDAENGPHDYLVWTNPNNVNETYVMHLDRH